MKKLLFLALSALTLFSCTKSENSPGNNNNVVNNPQNGYFFQTKLQGKLYQANEGATFLQGNTQQGADYSYAMLTATILNNFSFNMYADKKGFLNERFLWNINNPALGVNVSLQDNVTGDIYYGEIKYSTLNITRSDNIIEGYFTGCYYIPGTLDTFTAPGTFRVPRSQ